MFQLKTTFYPLPWPVQLPEITIAFFSLLTGGAWHFTGLRPRTSQEPKRCLLPGHLRELGHPHLTPSLKDKGIATPGARGEFHGQLCGVTHHRPPSRRKLRKLEKFQAYPAAPRTGHLMLWPPVPTKELLSSDSRPNF